MEDQKQFTYSILKEKKGEKYNEDEFIKLFDSYGFADIQVNDSGEYRRFSMKDHFKSKGRDMTGMRTAFIRFDENMIINKVKWIVYDAESLDNYNTNNGCGLAFILAAVGIVITLGYFLIAGLSDVISNWDSDDSDCNDSYVEMDYNNDGEKDAEDFRIQTEGCE